MTDTLSLLHTPPGVLGSGRVRYGAAMALYGQGRITADVLEVYRVASAHDGRDPLAILREGGFSLPPMTDAQTPVAALYAAARDYLLALDHPGAAEVRAGLPVDPGPERRMLNRPNAVVETWLPKSLGALAQSRPVLAAAITAAAGRLDWVTYDAYPLAEIGEGFATGHAFASLLGGDAPFAAKDFDMGVFLVAPDTLYRDHQHAAPELYAPLTGPHGWRFGPGRPLQIKPAHEPVWNPPHQPHLTKTGKIPFLSLFVWTRDVNDLAIVIPAQDWPALEAQEIG